MRGSSMVFDRLPKPTELAVRVVAASVLVLGLGRVAGPALVQTMAPAVRAAFELIDDDFQILDLAVVREEQHSIFRLRADFARPTYVNGFRLTPRGAYPGELGWYQVQITIGGVLQGAIVALVVLLAWP